MKNFKIQIYVNYQGTEVYETEIEANNEEHAEKLFLKQVPKHKNKICKSGIFCSDCFNQVHEVIDTTDFIEDLEDRDYSDFSISEIEEE
jgi:glycine betaine/choline ABC-type transport system substrate-binding protein